MAYKLIHETFWTDPKIKNLTFETKALFLYLLTNPHSHFTGIYYLPKKIISIETNLSDRGIDRGMDTLSIGCFLKYDPVVEVVFIKNMFKYQSVSWSKDQRYNENQLKGISNHLKTLHNSLLINDFLDFYKDLNIPFSKIPLDRGIDRGMDSPIDRAPYTDTDTDTDTDKDSLGKSENPFLEIPFKEILNDLEEKTDKKYKPTKDIKELISGRWCDGFGLEDFKQVHTNMAAKWLGDPEWDRFLQPSTLYRKTKFQGYLNAKPMMSDTGKVSKTTQKNLRVFENFKTGESNAE